MMLCKTAQNNSLLPQVINCLSGYLIIFPELCQASLKLRDIHFEKLYFNIIFRSVSVQ
jgi:hypothetical protein